MGGFAVGRQVQRTTEGYELQEAQSSYNAVFDTENLAEGTDTQ